MHRDHTTLITSREIKAFDFNPAQMQKIQYWDCLLDLAPVGIVLIDTEGIIRVWNFQASQIFQRDEKRVLNIPLVNIFPTNARPKVKSFLFKNPLSAEPQTEIFPIKTKGGKAKLVEVKISWIVDKIEVKAIIVLQDVTEQVLEEEKHKNLENQKDEFLAIASHELKTPVTSIKAFTQILQKRFEQSQDKESALYLAKMENQLGKLTKLISELLDITRIQTGKLSFHKERFYIEELIKDTAEDMQKTAEKHRIIAKGQTKVYVLADRDRVTQVITNLLSNAIKYSPQSDRIVIRSLPNSHEVIISIQDFGIGIPKEYYERIFERFFRGIGPKRETYPGLGLGLYISKEIIKRHGGRIWVESTWGKGSTFFFTLPMLRGKK